MSALSTFMALSDEFLPQPKDKTGNPNYIAHQTSFLGQAQLVSVIPDKFKLPGRSSGMDGPLTAESLAMPANKNSSRLFHGKRL